MPVNIKNINKKKIIKNIKLSEISYKINDIEIHISSLILLPLIASKYQQIKHTIKATLQKYTTINYVFTIKHMSLVWPIRIYFEDCLVMVSGSAFLVFCTKKIMAYGFFLVSSIFFFFSLLLCISVMCLVAIVFSQCSDQFCNFPFVLCSVPLWGKTTTKLSIGKR